MLTQNQPYFLSKVLCLSSKFAPGTHHRREVGSTCSPVTGIGRVHRVHFCGGDNIYLRVQGQRDYDIEQSYLRLIGLE